MEFVSKIRWVVVVFAALLILILIGWGLATAARGVFGSIGNGTTISSEQEVQLSTLSPNSVRYSVAGPIVASAEHRSYTIEVTEDVVIMRLYADYGQTVLREKSYRNNEAAFDSFIEALDNENASARVRGTSIDDDFLETGTCPAGRRHVLEIDQDIRRWRTNCEEFPGTAGGDMPAIRKLFGAQVPDFRDIIKGTRLI